MEKKKEYYLKIYAKLMKKGYFVYSEEQIKGTKIKEGITSKGKLVDGIFCKKDMVLIGEIKSPEECSEITGTAKIDLDEDKGKGAWNGNLVEYEDFLNKKMNLDEKEKAHLIHIKKTEIIKNQIIKNGYFELRRCNIKIPICSKHVYIAYIVPQNEACSVKNALNNNREFSEEILDDAVNFIIKN